jgi:tRNA (guanine10-N2)-dimethyltransferase
MYLYFLGSHPPLSLAELESLLGPTKLRVLDRQIAESMVEVDIRKLGGTTKIAELIAELDIEDDLGLKLKELILEHSPKTEGKLNLGLSVYGKKMPPPEISALGFKLKNELKPKLNLRIAPSKAQSLNTAQIIGLKLGRAGLELNLIFKKNKILIAKTTQIQNLKSYTLRDYERPARDARVGMLPPKLAQIMLNLSLGETEGRLTVLDPFCGTGVVLQEAALRGFKFIGSDIEPRMIEMTRKNLEFTALKFKLGLSEAEIGQSTFVGDATSTLWPEFDAVTSEVFLGQPLTRLPEKDRLVRIISDVNLITKKFLLNLKAQIRPGVKICLAVPAWRNGTRPDLRKTYGYSGLGSGKKKEVLSERGEAVASSKEEKLIFSGRAEPENYKGLCKSGQFIELPLIDQLGDLGYNRVSLKLATDAELIYFREDSTVARRIILLEAKEKL